MAIDSQSKPSFSPYRKWSIGLEVLLVIGAVLALVVMVNYISREIVPDRYKVWYVSSKASIPLAPRTVRLLEGLTNEVKVTVYYDKDEPFYSTIMDLLEQYQIRSRKLSLKVVDYKRDPGAASSSRANIPSWRRPQPRTW